MHLPSPPLPVAQAGLRALYSVALADAELDPLEEELLDSVQRHILRVDLDDNALLPIDANELATSVVDPGFRERIIGGCVLMSLIDGSPSPAELEVIESFAAALEVKPPVLKNLHRLTHGHLMLARFDIARRSFIGQKVKERIDDSGLFGMAKVIKAMRVGDEMMAGRYRVLEQYPDGTLGREYARFVRDNGFGFPGEVGGAPEVIVFHDCTHVLGGYGTSPSEEVQVASFSAASRRHDPFSILLFVVAQFHLGLRVTPAAQSERMMIEPEQMIRAIERGAQMNIDLSDRWDPFAVDFEVPVSELRTRYNILPRV